MNLSILLEMTFTCRAMFLGLFLLGCTTLALADPSLTLQSPGDYQVFQRQNAREGMVKLTGTTEHANVRYRLQGEWQTLPCNPQTHQFSADIRVAAGGWYRLEVEAGLTKASVEHVGVGEVFIVAGQSNAGNYGSEKQTSTSGRVSAFDGKQWVLANDPQPGAGGGGGSFMPAFGDAMVRRWAVPIGLVPVAVGSTSVRQWLPRGIKFKQNTTTGLGVIKVGDEFESDGKLSEKLLAPMKTPGIGGFRAVLWHQGESDVGQPRSGYPADRQISGAQYFEFMAQLIHDARDVAGWPVPWFTAVTTFHSETDASDEEFRSAMQMLWRKGISWPGPDTDELRGDLRAGVHFNGKGLQKHGELWAEKVSLWLSESMAKSGDGPLK